MRKLAPVIALCLSFAPLASAAHELWLEPLDYQVPSNGQLKARVVNGEDFEGTVLPYLPNRIGTFTITQGDRTYDVVARAGDTPALNMTAEADGLHVVAYQSTVATISYATWEKFQRFVDHKDFGDVRSRHDARGLPEADFSEAYVRYSKTLIGVGDSAGSDQRVGFLTEIVALENPYTDDLSDGFQVQVFEGDAARADVQVEIFAKDPTNAVTVSYVRTDENGIATIPVTAGTEYQLDAVVLREPSESFAERSGAVWLTLWANLTFAAP